MTRRDIRVYIGGPISGANILESLRNLDFGQAMTAKVFQLGFSPFPVFSDFSFIQRVRPVPAINDVYNYSLEWLKVSDAMLVIDGWEKSTGCKQEMRVAQEHDIPIFFDVVELCAWADDKVTCDVNAFDLYVDEQLRNSDD